MHVAIPDWSTLRLVMPEIWLIIAMCVVLLVPFVRRRDIALPTAVTVIGLFAAMFAATQSLAGLEGASILGGMLVIDPFSQVFKFLLAVFTILVVIQWLIAGRERTSELDVPDMMCLILGAATGMALMASANNLLMIFIAIETASLPSYALAGFRKRHGLSSEGSLKYVIFGSAASAIMLYGMSLIYVSAGSLALGDVAAAAVTSISPLMAVGLMGLLGGIAFKLSAVPMHFWCPDVFEGAPTEVTTFLSVASKGAAVCLLVRVLHSFQATGVTFAGIMVGVGILGAVTATWGNLVALHQTKIKRLLAYSSIAHAGYMIMAASVILGVRGADGPLSVDEVTGAILFYLGVYTFMNLGAFTVAAIIGQQTGSEDITDYAALIRRSPVLAVLMAMFLLSLFGMPGLGGFMGKMLIGVTMIKLGGWGFFLVAVLLVNTLLSLYYYMRPVYYMVLQPDTERRRPVLPSVSALAMLAVCAVTLVLTGVLPQQPSTLLREFSHVGAVSEAGAEDKADDDDASEQVAAAEPGGRP